jgi:hypothetical protein
LALRHARLDSPAAVLNAPRERLAYLGSDRAAIVRLVRTGDQDVMRALFVPADQLDWLVAMLTSAPAERLLSAWQGSATLLRLTYRVDDGADERRAWAALKAVLLSATGM